MSKFLKDEIVEGCVTGIEKYGIFVTLDEYYSGLIHISEISDGFVRDINKVANIGETIKVRVIDTDDDTFHVRLSIKNLDYRSKRRVTKEIQETEHGFSTLKNNLETWIQFKQNEKNAKTS